MKSSTALFWLGLLVAACALIVSAAGLFWRQGGVPFSFTTVCEQA